MTTDRFPAGGTRRAGRRKHAVASRIVAAGLSAATSIVLVTALARSDAATPARRTDPPSEFLLLPDAGAGADSTTRSAPPLTRSEAPPLTTSQAS